MTNLTALCPKDEEIWVTYYKKNELLFFLTGPAGMPSTLGELGGKEEDIPTLVKNLCYGDGRDGTISGFVTLNEDDCTKIYKNMI